MKINTADFILASGIFYSMKIQICDWDDNIFFHLSFIPSFSI